MKVLSGVYPYGSYEGQIIYGERKPDSKISRNRKMPASSSSIRS